MKSFRQRPAAALGTLLAGLWLSTIPAPGANLLANWDFSAQEGGRAQAWTLRGAPTLLFFEPDGGPEGLPAQRVESRGSATIELSQTVSVPPATTFYFQARIRTSRRAEVIIGRRRMAYSGGGEWQTIADLVKTDRQTELTVTIRLRGAAEGDSNAFFLSDVHLFEVPDIPSLPPRPLYGNTTLTENGRPAAFIVYPADPPEYALLAGDIQEAVREVSGVVLPLVSDVEATGPAGPVLQEPYRSAHLILLGRLGINRALWPAYNRFLAAVDGYYPGGDGTVVRTAANVLRNGKNHLIVGGSSDAGAARAVARFKELIEKAAGGGDLTLPWLLDVELGGTCREALEAADRMWTEDPENPALLTPEPGYKTVIRWYMNAMGYYWSGFDSYRQRAIEYFLPVLEDQAYTHHYIVEFFVRAYDMLDDSGLFTPEQTAAADALILKNFWELTTGPDLGWFTLFSPPYENLSVRNRHAISPWMGDLMMADFLQDYFPLRGGLARIVAYRRAEKHPFFQHLVGERWQSSLPRLSVTHDGEITALLFRYALHHERYEFFERGHARQALLVESLTPARTATMDDHLLLGILAHYYADGRYRTLLEQTPAPSSLFQSRYVAGVRRYRPGDEIPPADPGAFWGVRTPRLQPHDKKALHGMSFTIHRNPAVDPEHAFELATLRDGFDNQADYLQVSGLGNNAGAVTSLASHGRRLLHASANALFGPTTDSYFDRNALSVLRTDRWIEDPKPYAGAARRDWLANFLEPGGGLSFTLDPFMTASWRRDVLWLDRGLFVVRDAVTALEDGTYSISIGWRPEGAPSWDGTAWTGELPGLRFRITPLGPGFRVVQNVESFLSGDAPHPVFRHALDAALQQGQTATATALLQVTATGSPMYEARLADEDTLLLTAPDAALEPLAVLWGPVRRPDWSTDARVAVLRRQQVDFLHATQARAGGGALLSAERPVSARLDAAAGLLLLDEDGEAPRSVALPEDRQHNLAGLLDTLLEAPALPREEDPGQAGALRLAARDDTAHWRERWRYDGLQLPALITTGRNRPGDVYDLGREVAIGEIRAVRTGRFWTPSPLPKMETALALDGEWRPVDDPVRWRPGLRTGNYGEATPVDQGFQVVHPRDLRARFIRAENAHQLLYYDAETREARAPVRLAAADMDGDGVPEILAAPDPWPPFLRSRDREDTVLALLRADDGAERFRLHPFQNIQQTRLLASHRGAPPKLYVLTQDARLRIFEADGRLYREDNLYAMHQEFNRTKGRPNTRQPAGGFTMPYSVGLWRPDGQGRYKTIVSRYGAYSFLDGEGRFEGLLNVGDYVLARLLPYGEDFSGDGREEQLCLGRYGMTRLTGEAVPVIPEPDGARFFPQVYAGQRIGGVGTSGRTVDGLPVYLFEAVPLGAEAAPRQVLIVREGGLGLYDLRAAKNPVFAWAPVVAIRAAAVTESSADRLTVVVATDGPLLWELSWENGIASDLAGFRAAAVAQEISVLRGGTDGALWIGARDGLYRLEDFRDLRRIARGAYQDVLPLPGPGGGVAAATARGGVVRFERAP